jgi:hypothetical protein
MAAMAQGGASCRWMKLLKKKRRRKEEEKEE